MNSIRYRAKRHLMHWMLGGFGIAALSGACGSRDTAIQSKAVPSQSSSSVGAPPSPQNKALNRPELLEARLTELHAAWDFRNTFWFHPNPVRLDPGAAIPKTGPLMKGEIKKATVYAYHFQDRGDSEDEPCNIFDRNGRFCYHVIDPGVPLQQDQFDRLAAFLSKAEAGGFREGESQNRARTRCEFEPHHFILLMDEKDKPLGQLEICFTCGEWLSLPHSEAISGDAPALMYGEEKRFLRSLCEELKLPGCFFGDDELMGALFDYRKKVYFDENGDASARAKTELAKKSSGVKGALMLKDVPELDKARLCAFAQEYLSYSFVRQRHFSVCEQEHRGIERLSFKECLSQFPKASKTVDQAERCIRKLAGPPAMWCKESLPDECVGLESSTIGFSIRDLKKKSNQNAKQ